MSQQDRVSEIREIGSRLRTCVGVRQHSHAPYRADVEAVRRELRAAVSAAVDEAFQSADDIEQVQADTEELLQVARNAAAEAPPVHSEPHQPPESQ